MSNRTKELAGIASQEIRDEKAEFVKNLFKRKHKDIKRKENEIEKHQNELTELREDYQELADKPVEDIYDKYNTSGEIVMTLSELHASSGCFSIN